MNMPYVSPHWRSPAARADLPSPSNMRNIKNIFFLGYHMLHNAKPNMLSQPYMIEPETEDFVFLQTKIKKQTLLLASS